MKNVCDITEEIIQELDSAIKKHPKFPCDLIHMVAIMNEEAGESIRAALNYIYEGGTLNELEVELKQTAAMCIRCLVEMYRKDS